MTIPEPGDIWYFNHLYDYDGPLLIYKLHHTYLTITGPEYQFLALKLLTGEMDYFLFTSFDKDHHWRFLA